MTSFVRANFYDQHTIRLKRTDPMRPVNQGDGPGTLELNLKNPMHASETIMAPVFGNQTLYTGELVDGSERRPVFVKWARSRPRVAELKKEGNFYCSALRKLHGVVVPNFYGCYVAVDSEWHGFGCMILERMDREDVTKIDDRSKLEAAYRLHNAGVCHGGFQDSKTFVRHKGEVFLVGFSTAKRCGCEMGRDQLKLCPEMMWMEQELGDGGDNRVLKEIGVPCGWERSLLEAARMSGQMPARINVRC